MRIMQFVSSPAAGGAETYVRDLSIQMSRSGHDLHIVFLESAAENGRDLEFEKKFLAELESASVLYSFVGVQSRRAPWLGITRLRRIVKEFSPDLIHCHLYYALIFAWFVFSVPIIYTHHSVNIRMPKLFYRVMDSRVKAYIGICKACQKALNVVTPNRVVRINNGVPSERLIRKSTGCVTHGELVRLFFVGRLTKQKNLRLLFESIASLKEYEVTLTIAGEGPDRQELEQLSRNLRLDNCVKFVGNVSNVSERLNESDVFVMSSAWEGLPIALIEATMSGLPVIVTDVGGCAEVVHRCAHGFVVDELVVSEYRKALEQMLVSKQVRESFSRNALKFSSCFDIRVAAEKHIELYESLNK